MKKLLLGLGTAAAIVAPITAVVACSTSETISLGANTKITTKDGLLSEITITAAEESDTAEIIAATFKPGANADVGGWAIDLVKAMNANEIKGYIKVTGVTTEISDSGKLVIAKAIEANLHPAPVAPAETDLDSSKSETDLKAVLPTAVTSIDTANTELGIALPILVGSDFKSITWDNSTLMLTLVTTVTATQTDTTMIYKVVPATPVAPAETDLDSSKSETDLKAVLPTAVTSIDTANTELGIALPTLVGSDFKSITWDNSTLMLTLVTTVTATQTDTTMIYKVVPAVIHNLDATTEVFVNNNKITKIKITANTADDASSIAAKYVPFALNGEEVSMMIEKLDDDAISKLLEIIGPTNAIDTTGKLTIAEAIKKAVTNSTKVYNLNAFTKVTVENDIVTKVEITSDTSTIDVITTKYLPNSLAGNDASATLLESMDASAIAAVMEITGPTNVVDDAGKLTIATALKNAVTTIADGKHILDGFTSVYIVNGEIRTIDIGAVTSDDSAETIAGKYLSHSLVGKTAEGAAIIAKLDIQEIAQKIIVYIHNPNDATKLTIATALKNAVI